jgi:hypothetical protein
MIKWSSVPAFDLEVSAYFLQVRVRVRVRVRVKKGLSI